MLYINEEIKRLFQLIETPLSYKEKNLFNRLQAWAILVMFNDVNNTLAQINEQLDKSLSHEALGIDFNTFLNSAYSLRKKLPIIAKNSLFSHEAPQTYQRPINQMTDYLPNGISGYDITSDVVGSFKTAMHQLCDEDRISPRALETTLYNALDSLCVLLGEIKKKVENPEPYLYIKLWNDSAYSYSNSLIEYEYRKWVKEIGKPDLNDLNDKRNYAIFELLTSGFFKFCPPPTRGAVSKRSLKISEDDLAVGTTIPDGFDVECTKFEKFIEWKGNLILTLNYEKLGQYIYKNYRNLNDEHISNIIYFDSLLELIQEDMAKLKPELAQYLKRYQEQQDKELLNDIKKVFEPFKEYLKEDIRPSLIDEYLKKLLFDSEVKEEAKKLLGCQSKNKYCCSIVLALRSCYIFKPEYNNTDYAKVLHEGLLSVTKDTFIRYFKSQEINNKALNQWTTHIMDDLKTTPFTRPAAG